MAKLTKRTVDALKPQANAYVAYEPDYVLARKHNIPWDLIRHWTEWHWAGEPNTDALQHPAAGSAGYFRDKERRLVAEYRQAMDRRKWLRWMVISGFCGALAAVECGVPVEQGVQHFLVWLAMFYVTWIGAVLVAIYAWVAWESVFGEFSY